VIIDVGIAVIDVGIGLVPWTGFGRQLDKRRIIEIIKRDFM
jgi:hypothetical protein